MKGERRSRFLHALIASEFGTAECEETAELEPDEWTSGTDRPMISAVQKEWAVELLMRLGLRCYYFRRFLPGQGFRCWFDFNACRFDRLISWVVQGLLEMLFALLHSFAKFAHAFSQAAHEFRNLLAAKQKEHDYEDDQVAVDVPKNR